MLWQQRERQRFVQLAQCNIVVHLFVLFIFCCMAERVSLDKDDDEDLGGYDIVESGSQLYVLIENLEKDLSASSIRRFICENTSVLPQACLFASQLSVPSARGAIASTSKKNIEKIYEFLVNPKHLIVSASGRYASILHIYCL